VFVDALLNKAKWKIYSGFISQIAESTKETLLVSGQPGKAHLFLIFGNYFNK